MTTPLIGGQVIGNDMIDLIKPTLNVHESHYGRTSEIIMQLTIERLALIVFHSLSNLTCTSFSPWSNNVPIKIGYIMMDMVKSRTILK